MNEIPTELRLTVGESVQITLPGLATAGYRWNAEVTGDEEALTLSWQRGLVPGSAPRQPGVSAPETLSIQGRRPGTARVRLVQARPWELSGAPRAVHEVLVTVDS
jgi:predicted secreted protein